MENMNFDGFLTLIAPKMMEVEKRCQGEAYELPDYKLIGEKVESLKRHARRVDNTTIAFVEEASCVESFPGYAYVILEGRPLFREDREDGAECRRLDRLQWFLHGRETMEAVTRYLSDQRDGEVQTFVFFRSYAAYREARIAYCARRPDGTEIEVNEAEFMFADEMKYLKDHTVFVKLEGVCELETEDGRLTLPCYSVSELADSIAQHVLIDIMHPEAFRFKQGMAQFGGKVYPFLVSCSGGTGAMELYDEDGKRFDFGTMRFCPVS